VDKARLDTEVASGALIIGFGLLAFWLLRATPSGSIEQMGPSFLPRAVAAALLVTGLAQLAAAFSTAPVPLARWSIRSFGFVAASIVAFGLLVSRFGLVAATIAAVVVAIAANPEARWKEAVFLTLALTAFCVLLFVHLLGLQIRVWPTWG